MDIKHYLAKPIIDPKLGASDFKYPNSFGSYIGCADVALGLCVDKTKEVVGGALTLAACTIPDPEEMKAQGEPDKDKLPASGVNYGAHLRGLFRILTGKATSGNNE